MNKEEILEKKENNVDKEHQENEVVNKDIISKQDKEEINQNNIENNIQSKEEHRVSGKEENIDEKKIDYEKKDNKKSVKKERKSKSKVVILIIVFIIVLSILSIPIIFCTINYYNKNIFEGIKINKIDVSKMSIEEAKNILNENVKEKINKNIVLTGKEYEKNTTPEQAGITFDIDKAIEDAYNVGRNENFVFNNFKVLQTMLNGEDIDLDITIDENKFKILVQEINGSLENEIQQPSYYINGSEIIINSGKEGNATNESELKKIISNILKSENNNEEKVSIPIQITKQDKIDLDKIYNEIHKEAQDAYVTKNPFQVHPHIDGVDFEISLEEARKLLQEEKEEYKIALKITKPSVTTDSLGDEAFPNRLATYSTKYSTAEVNRSTNIQISVDKINGVVIMPGEEFSYNKILGPRTPQAGYKLGAAYIGGKVVSDYGGGVCQTSSTLYNSVLLSNLEVTSRSSHYFQAAYVPIGRDATVYWPSLDFKFKNNRNYPIRIKAFTNNGTITVEIFGVKEESDYEVELESYVTRVCSS